jgi:AcrR family transcriptional regulator
MIMARKSGSNEQSRERSKAQLLQAGADLLLDQALQNPFATLRLRSLCAKAHMSTGAFYVHWATLEEYYDELARHLTEEDELAFQADFATLTGIAESDNGDSALAAIQELAETDLSLLVANPLWDAMELVALTWGRTHFRDQLQQGYQTIDRTTGHIYGTALSRYGREPRPPMDWDSIGAILQGLAEGLGLRHKIDATAPSSKSAARLYATGAAAILAVLTRPGGDHTTADEALTRLLEP